MSKLNPYDLDGMRKAAEHSKGAYDRDKIKRLERERLERELEAEGNNRFVPYRIGEKAPEPAPDLLSLADSLAEAARKAYDGNMLFHHRGELGAALYNWDAARKGIEGHEFGR